MGIKRKAAQGPKTHRDEAQKIEDLRNEIVGLLWETASLSCCHGAEAAWNCRTFFLHCMVLFCGMKRKMQDENLMDSQKVLLKAFLGFTFKVEDRMDVLVLMALIHLRHVVLRRIL